MNNTFASVCQCCGRTIKGSERKYLLEIRFFSPKGFYGEQKVDKVFSICRGCNNWLNITIANRRQKAIAEKEEYYS